MNSPARIALFGGTFDPVHKGHLAVAHTVCQQLTLDRVVFIPSGTPPHRANGPLATAAQRCAMVALAIAGEPRFELSDIEARRDGPSYTVDTVRAFADAHPDATLHFILGDDCVAKLHRWKGIEEMLERITFVAARRIGGAPDASVSHRVQWVDMAPMPQASTWLRAALAADLGIASETAPAVAHYIAEHGLYRSPLTP